MSDCWKARAVPWNEPCSVVGTPISRRACSAGRAVVRSGVTLQELVDGLNALGLGPRDLISILQAIKAAGALQADVKVM